MVVLNMLVARKSLSHYLVHHPPHCVRVDDNICDECQGVTVTHPNSGPANLSWFSLVTRLDPRVIFCPDSCLNPTTPQSLILD